MSVYYSENDPKAAAWLRELIFEGQIAWGDVDERSIEDVKPSELVGYAQCHFFAGIGGWSYALRLAGWPDDRPVWTGSCPCQPFSAAGRQRGFEDPRHFWPAWFRLIRECTPAVIFGEQVASPAGLAWFDLVHANVEGSAYAVAAADLCAAGVGAPHIRQRLYWVAHRCGDERDTGRPSREDGRSTPQSTGRGNADGLAHHHHLGREQHAQRNSEEIAGSEEGASWLDTSGCSELRLAHAGGERLEVLGFEQARGQRPTAERGGAADPCWSRVTWLPCRDGKWRPVEPGSFPLAHGIPGRVGLLRGYGNAIVPQVAAAFIDATGLA